MEGLPPFLGTFIFLNMSIGLKGIMRGNVFVQKLLKAYVWVEKKKKTYAAHDGYMHFLPFYRPCKYRRIPADLPQFTNLLSPVESWQ